MKDFDTVISDFRWPRKGDLPFRSSKDVRKNARVEPHASSRLVMMMEGYKKAADLMVVQARGSTYDRDLLVYPIIFNYRQFLELGLKYLIASYGRPAAIEPNWKSHDLSFLWSQFRQVLEWSDAPGDDAEGVFERIVAQFAKIDPSSYSYRYPVDRQGRPIPVEHEDLDLDVLADVMRGVSGYIDGCDGYLDNLVHAGP